MMHSKYYYDYFRNMSEEQIKEHCGRPNCEKEFCICTQDNTGSSDFFEAWTKSLEELPQPECSIDNKEDCENCGS